LLETVLISLYEEKRKIENKYVNRENKRTAAFTYCSTIEKTKELSAVYVEPERRH
jgi:hypothetical protein